MKWTTLIFAKMHFIFKLGRNKILIFGVHIITLQKFISEL
jgi:hypothetical protein